jgi:two-component system nitrate/nitrite sensor histidine kinase NarX
VLVTRYLVNPLTQLATSVSQFSSGNWEARTEIKRDDEVGLLASSFNQMASDLSVLYQSLEAKVEERTRQLQTSSELSQLSITAADLDELLSETVTLL